MRQFLGSGSGNRQQPLHRDVHADDPAPAIGAELDRSWA